MSLFVWNFYRKMIDISADCIEYIDFFIGKRFSKCQNWWQYLQKIVKLTNSMIEKQKLISINTMIILMG